MPKRKYINVPISKNQKPVLVKVISIKTLFSELKDGEFYICDNCEDDNFYHCQYEYEYILIRKTDDKVIFSNFTLTDDDTVEFSSTNDDILYMAMSQDSIRGMTMKEVLDYNVDEYCKCYNGEPYDKSYKITATIGDTDKLPGEITYDLIAKLHDKSNLGVKSE